MSEQKERVPITPALKQKIQTCIAVREQCNDWEKDFIGTIEKVLENPSWTLTPKRVEVIKKIIAKYVTKTEGNNESEIHEGDFSAIRTNDGWRIERKKSPIGVMTSRTEAEYIISWLSQSWGSIAVEVVNGQDGAGIPGATEPGEEDVIYEDEDSPTGFTDKHGAPCDENGNVIVEDDEDILPF